MKYDIHYFDGAKCPRRNPLLKYKTLAVTASAFYIYTLHAYIANKYLTSGFIDLYLCSNAVAGKTKSDSAFMLTFDNVLEHKNFDIFQQS